MYRRNMCDVVEAFGATAISQTVPKLNFCKVDQSCLLRYSSYLRYLIL
jgi:hypothetical protein